LAWRDLTLRTRPTRKLIKNDGFPLAEGEGRGTSRGGRREQGLRCLGLVSRETRRRNSHSYILFHAKGRIYKSLYLTNITKYFLWHAVTVLVEGDFAITLALRVLNTNILLLGVTAT
jgi:hypothetical protein